MISLPISSMFICLWMIIVVIRSDVIANHYTQQPRYTGKFIASFNAEEYKADSILPCLAFCGPFCTCFGYQQSTKRCCVFDFCLDRNESFIEDGWVYYTSPSGELNLMYFTCIFLFDVLNCNSYKSKQQIN